MCGVFESWIINSSFAGLIRWQIYALIVWFLVFVSYCTNLSWWWRKCWTWNCFIYVCCICSIWWWIILNKIPRNFISCNLGWLIHDRSTTWTGQQVRWFYQLYMSCLSYAIDQIINRMKTIIVQAVREYIIPTLKTCACLLIDSLRPIDSILWRKVKYADHSGPRILDSYDIPLTFGEFFFPDFIECIYNRTVE